MLDHILKTITETIFLVFCILFGSVIIAAIIHYVF